VVLPSLSPQTMQSDYPTKKRNSNDAVKNEKNGDPS